MNYSVRDYILGTLTLCSSYKEAKLYALNRIRYHKSDFYYKRGRHNIINCELIEDKTNKTLIIKRN